MKLLVILAMAGVCVALPQGFLSDTPEVIAEKQKFFQLYRALAKAAADAPDDPIVWRGPFASTVPAGVDGNLIQVADTPEVIAARQAFSTFYNNQLRSVSPQPQPHTRQERSVSSPVWTGPFAATIPAGLPGAGSQVRNTAEVEAAIAEFTRAYNAAVVATRARTFLPIQETPKRWLGPFAATIPAGLPGSTPQVPDTADVVASKAAFQRAYQQQLALTAPRPKL